MAASRGDSNQLPSSQRPLRRSNRRSRSRSSTTEHPQKNLSQQQSLDSSVVHSFRPKSRPLWLTLLLRFQQGTSVVTILLVVGILVAYGWTVVIQERWGKAYEKLETLNKQERQLVSANEVLKNQMAEQAEKPTAGLLLPDPSNAIFLTPAPQRPEAKPKSTVPAESVPTRPLGY
jgi:hypothetical protein